MAWLAVDDQAPDDPKVLRAGCEVFGFAVLCAAWSAGKGGEGKVDDGFVPEYLAARIGGDDWSELASRAVAAKLFTRPKKSRGEPGWFVDPTDRLLHMLTHEQVMINREKGKTTRRKEEVRLVRLRDGDQCRYCEKAVDWNDRVSGMGGTYDHPDPADRDTFVVCCFACNRTKSRRTPAQWLADEPDTAHTLKPEPETPYIGPQTAKRFSVPQTAPTRAPKAQTSPTRAPKAQTSPGARPQGADATARAPKVQTPPRDSATLNGDAADAPGQRSDTARTEGPGGPGPTYDLPSAVLHTSPVRDGSGRVGQVSQPVRAGPRRAPRGSRGKRKASP